MRGSGEGRERGMGEQEVGIREPGPGVIQENGVRIDKLNLGGEAAGGQNETQQARRGQILCTALPLNLLLPPPPCPGASHILTGPPHPSPMTNPPGAGRHW